MLTSPAANYSPKEIAGAIKELNKRIGTKGTIVGIVSTEGKLIHSLVKKANKWIKTKDKPSVLIAEKLEPVLKSNKRFIIVIGGRGSSKSIGVMDICIIDAKDDNAKTYFIREFQSSIRNSVQSLLAGEIKRLELPGFEVQGNTVLHNEEPIAEFAGLARNVDSIKSAYGFKRYEVEEAQFLTEPSLTALTPTARNKPNKGLPGAAKKADKDMDSVSMIFIANPGSSEDPFSKRFIEPFKDHLDRDGFYEDDLHLIVKMNYMDNPWFEESGLEAERMWDYEYRSRAAYNHIWLGEYNDGVDDALIMGEWFDACIDSHLKLGFKPQGAKIVTHDPSDTGFDSKGQAYRHGSVFLDVQEKLDGDVNEGGHWSVGIANQLGADYYSWDCDGMGVGLNEQISKDFGGKQTKIVMFKGSEGPDTPEAIYKPAVDSPTVDQKTIKDVFKNKRAQYYWELRDRIYRTYRSVMFGEYNDPDKLISFDSNIKLMGKLRAELCRLPIKPNGNGYLQLYTKQEMKTKFKIQSPNLGDCVMMSMRYVPQTSRINIRRPRSIRPMGIR